MQWYWYAMVCNGIGNGIYYEYGMQWYAMVLAMVCNGIGNGMHWYAMVVLDLGHWYAMVLKMVCIGMQWYIIDLLYLYSYIAKDS
jgi:hypothetical protein